MSNNPFDDHSASVATFRSTSSSAVASMARPRGGGTGGRRRSGGGGGSSSSAYHHHGAADELPAIWAARTVEWPIPYSLSLANYNKLIKASAKIGVQLGITTKAAAAAAAAAATSRSTIDETTPASASSSAANLDDVGGRGGGGGGDVAGGGEHPSSTYYGGLSGFMSRVLNTSAGSADSKIDDMLAASSSGAPGTSGGGGGGGAGSSTRPLLPPRPGCVAASNGWIVAVLECPLPNHNNIIAAGVSTGTTAINTLPSADHNVFLRLVSRWNVRRGGLADQMVALPPPAINPAISGINSDVSIRHVFVDPTASHTLLSAANGECYYLHSSQKSVTKLSGFGLGVDAQYNVKELTGVAATSLPRGSSSSSTNAASANSTVQSGLTVGTYVTAVAWDKEKGTEGSTKKILLGSSDGQIYEYSLQSPESSKDSDTAPTSTFRSSTSDDPSLHGPVLLHKLSSQASSDPTEVGAAVTGLYFERLRTGLLVLAATSGRQKRTRFHTFYSAHSSSFQMTLGDQQHSSLTELPGSVEFADLRLCQDYFALRTATGIYYGKIDRSLSSTASASGRKLSGGIGGHSTMIVESGILPFDAPAGDSNSKGSSLVPHGQAAHTLLPVSLAITPHHLITLSELNEVCFINRVAQKVIQKERVDLGTGSSSSSAQTATMGHPDNEAHYHGELMMDIRRPDQVWFRRGRSLVHISSSQEDRDVWKFTLQKCLDMPKRTSNSDTATSQNHRSTTTSAATRWALAGLYSSGAQVLTDEEKAQEALFEQAKTLCTNAAQKAVVTAIRAEYHLSQGRAELAAKYFAQSSPILEPFADTAIRLALPKLGVDDPTSYGGSSKARESLEASNIPLIAYLSDKMRASGTMNDDKMTSTMLGAWLTELYLHERGERLGAASLHHDDDGDKNKKAAFLKEVEASQRAMLARFLNSNVNNMDAKTLIKILTSHGVGAAECATFAAQSGDISTAVNAALTGESSNTPSSRGAHEALQILNDAPFELAESLYYKHAPILLARAPTAAGESFLKRYAQGLSPLRLLPSIMHYERNRSRSSNALEPAKAKGSLGKSAVEGSHTTSIVGVSVDGAKGSSDGFELQVNMEDNGKQGSFVDAGVSTRYLEGVIQQGCRSSAVYSYLISLYAKLEDEEPLYNFLSTHVPATSLTTEAAKNAALSTRNLRGGSRNEDLQSNSPLDLSYALRTVLSTGRHFRSAIKLYMGFGMRQQAVELALKVDPSLARELAQDSVELDERKRLWLMIAKNAASDNSMSPLGGKDVVSRVVSVLKDCGPDVLSIEDVLPFLPDFAQIDQIKDEICEALTSYSSKIESYLKEMSECDQVCDNLRGEIRRLRNHRMRMKADARCALTHKVVSTAGEPFYIFPSGYVVLSSALKKEVIPYLNERQRARVSELEKLLSNGPEQANLDELQTELDGLIAAECPLTGSIMVESIDKDFEDTTEGDGFLQSSVERVEV